MKPGCGRCRASSVTGWLAPAAILIFLPKCPACLAVYLALGTGIGISLSAASYLRDTAVITCTFWLVYAVFRYMFRQRRRNYDKTIPENNSLSVV